MQSGSDLPFLSLESFEAPLLVRREILQAVGFGTTGRRIDLIWQPAHVSQGAS